MVEQSSARSDSVSDANIQEDLFKTLFAIKLRVKKEFQQNNLDLTPMHLRVIKALRKHAPLSQQLIADKMQRDKAQINRLIKDLVDKGLVVKEPSKQDKRAADLSLSNEGAQMYTQFREIERRANQVMLKGFSESEKTLFKALLVRINSNLDAGD